MPIRRSSSRGRTPQRRKLVWARQLITAPTTIAANAVSAINLMSDFTIALGAEPLGVTVMRVRGHLSFRGGAAGNAVRPVAALVRAPQTMVAANLDPVTGASEHLDWMYWEAWAAEPPLATEFATMNALTVDVKSRRRMEELGETLFLVIKNTHPTDGMPTYYSMSVLLALP